VGQTHKEGAESQMERAKNRKEQKVVRNNKRRIGKKGMASLELHLVMTPIRNMLQHAQHAATRCNTLQHAATRCNSLETCLAVAFVCNMLQHAL